MGKGWPWKKMKHGDEARSSRPKPMRVRVNITVEVARALYQHNISAGWDDVHFLGGWHLNACKVAVLPLSH
jgi:hypothetical protein